jgi:hypothetical protein
MSLREASIYRKCTGRQTLPIKPFNEAWVIAGRRARKSATAAVLGCYFATLVPVGGEFVIFLDRGSTSIISRSNAHGLSKKIIQKGLAFARDWSATVARSGGQDAQRSCPAGSVADAGLRWCGATPLSTERRISNVKGCEEICFDCSPHRQKSLTACF